LVRVADGIGCGVRVADETTGRHPKGVAPSQMPGNSPTSSSPGDRRVAGSIIATADAGGRWRGTLS
jgi:hypothetical protein